MIGNWNLFVLSQLLWDLPDLTPRDALDAAAPEVAQQPTG